MKLFHTLDLTFVWIQHIYKDKFTNLERSVNLMISLTEVSARLTSIQTGITHIQIDIDIMYTYLDTLLPPLTYREILENIKIGKAQHP